MTRLQTAAARGLGLLLIALILSGCNRLPQETGYGVFLSVTENLSQLRDYKTVVIDAQYFSKEEIAAFKRGGHTVYSYLNVGALENFRDYYDTWKPLALAPYENWEEEYWMDVSDQSWQAFLTDTLIPALLEKEIDGFFADNCDVYYHYPTPQMLQGLAAVMQAMVRTGKAVLINGGDVFLDAYCAGGGNWEDVITGINQETVFSRIRWGTNRFGAATKEDRAYFQDYIERYAAGGAEIFLLEYTHSRALAAKIKAYCDANGFSYYISDSIELDG